MNVKEASQKTGIPTDTIRYYEKEGLVPTISRDKAGNRAIDEQIIRRLEFAKVMRAAGMSVKALKKYVYLLDDDEDHTAEQKKILQDEIEAMTARRDAIDQAVDHLTYKLAHYDDHMTLAQKKLAQD